MAKQLNALQMFISGAEFTGGIFVGGAIFGLSKAFNSRSLRKLADDISRRVDAAQQEPIKCDITRLQRASWCVGYAACLGVFGLGIGFPIASKFVDATVASAADKSPAHTSAPTP